MCTGDIELVTEGIVVQCANPVSEVLLVVYNCIQNSTELRFPGLLKIALNLKCEVV